MKRNRTKQMFADALKELSRKKPLNKILIKDIVDSCDVNHNTFYYHFGCKDDLIWYIFQQDISQEYVSATETDAWLRNCYHILKTIHDNCDFYQQALKVVSYNDLRHMLDDLHTRTTTEYLDATLAGRKLSASARAFYISFEVHAYTETIIDYIKSGARTAPEKVLQYYYDFSAPFLSHVIDAFVAHDKEPGIFPEDR